MSVYDAVDRAFKNGGVCIDKNDLIFMVMNAFMNPSSLPTFYDERVEIFLEILSKNADLFLKGVVGKTLYFQKKIDYPKGLQDKVGVLWCFTELFYLYRQYLQAEESERYKNAKNYLVELHSLDVDLALVSGRGRPSQIAFYGLAYALLAVFKEFDFQNFEISGKFKLATGRMNNSENKTMKLDAKRMAMLTASIFCVQFPDRIYENKTEVELLPSYIHPYFHQLMHITSNLSRT